jgi:hypothetical protein
MYITTNHKTTSSKIVVEDYFALIVDFGEQKELVKHYRIYKGDTNFIEFEANYETGECLRMKLELCESYSIKDASLILPEAKSGNLVFSGGDILKKGTCELRAKQFNMTLFADGLHISLSENASTSLMKSGNVVFGLSGENLNEIFVGMLNKDELSHLMMELAENESK